MSDGYFEDEYDDEPTYTEAPQNSGPKALRDAYEREKEARKALEERLARLEEQDRKAKLADRLKNAGVQNPDALGEYAQLIDPDKAEDFLTAIKRSMGLEAPEQAQPAVSDEAAAALAAVTGEPTGTAPTGAAVDQAAVLGGVDNEDDFARLMGWR